MYEMEFKNIFAYAENKVDGMDIILSSEKNFSVKVMKQEIESYSYSDTRGMGIRILKDGKVGYAYTENFDEESLKMIVDEAVENSKVIDNIEEIIFANYPDTEFNAVIYRPEFDSIEITEKIQMAKDMEKLAYEMDKRVINVPYSVFNDSSSYVKIANTKGLNKEYTRNSALAYVSVLVEENDDKRTAFEFSIFKNLKDMNARQIVERAVTKAIGLLGKNPIEPGYYPIVFNNEMAATMLSIFTGVFSAEAVHEGRSMLKDKIGQMIANPLITMVDDPHDEEGQYCLPFDGEGYPTSKTVLIENGKLMSYLHNTVTAAKDKVTSTGNAARGYKTNLSVSAFNFKLIPGTDKKQDLLNQYDRVIEIVGLAGMHSGANSISGDFSLSGEGFLYEKGVNKGSLEQFVITGNFFEMLNNVDKIADDFEYSSSGIGSASILVKSLSISS